MIHLLIFVLLLVGLGGGNKPITVITSRREPPILTLLIGAKSDPAAYTDRASYSSEITVV